MDIPSVNDIPTVSKLAKEEAKLKQNVMKSRVEQLRENKDQVSHLIEVDAEELETHFVENPFIKLREKALQKNLDARNNLSEAAIKGDDED